MLVVISGNCKSVLSNSFGTTYRSPNIVEQRVFILEKITSFRIVIKQKTPN